MITFTGSSSHQQVGFQGAPVIYQSVTKINYGTHNPNGKTVYFFDTHREYSILNNPNAPLGIEIIDNSLSKGELTGEALYKYDSIAARFNLIRTESHEYSGFNGDIENGLNIWKRINYTTPLDGLCTESDNPDIMKVKINNDFAMLRYQIKFGAIRKTKTTLREYNDSGSFLETVTSINYNNTRLLYPNNISTTNGKGDILKSSLKYPGDHLQTDQDAPILNQLVSLNRLSIPYLKSSYSNNNLLKYSHSTYSTWNNNNKAIWLKKVEDYTNGQSTGFLEYKAYDNFGNALTLETSEGKRLSYLYGYNKELPIAEASNANSSEIFYTSFEEGGTNDVLAKTGRKSFSGDYVFVPPAGFTPATNSELTYWYWEANSWNFEKLNYSGGNVTLSKGTKIDEVRICPKTTLMKTYTYDPLIGMTSETDPNNISTYYEYDKLGRLQLIKDHKGNIIKKIDYNYRATYPTY